MKMKITSDQEALDAILLLVQATEDDFEIALAATVTIYRLLQRGHKDLSLEVLQTYKPN